MKKIKAIVLGAGGRGQFAYGEYALRNPQDIDIIAVAEPDDGRRNQFVEKHKISSDNAFSSWEDVLSKPKFADLVFVCTQDRMHVKPAVTAIEKGYDILLEKPIAPTYEECVLIASKAKEYNVSVAIAHVLRYTPFFISLKTIIDSKKMGEMIGFVHCENIGHIHYSHSFVRGNWRKEENSTPMILAKSCHDMDILLYLIGGNCEKLSSYGTKGYFSNKNKPKDSPERCLEGCIHSLECPYYAPKIYLNGNTSWPVNIITTDLTPTGIMNALEMGPYGKCVYSCDNNMTEHQVVSFKFDNAVTASFIMSAFTEETSRTLRIMFEKGELRGNMLTDEIEVINFATGEKTLISHNNIKEEGHGGGDEGLMKDLIAHLRDKKNFELKTSIEIALQSHKMAFAAHESMKEEKEIILNLYSNKN